MSAARETEWQRRTRRERERDEWLKTHTNECEICHRPPKSRGLSQDHDHRTGETRGWLCHSCNRKLWVGVTPEWLRAAAEYLERAATRGLSREQIDTPSLVGPAEVFVNDVRYVREETLFAAMEALDRCRVVLTQISDPSYVGSYGDREVIDIYRGWARHALEAK